MINEAAVRCFLTLARTLSFTETAKVLYMTQQSVSKYIARLEEDLGFPLFVRTHHYVRLTRAGETFFALFQDFSDRFGSAVEETRRYYSQLYQSLHIGYLEWLEISSSISRALKLVKSTNPELRFIGERHPQYELNALFLERKLDLIITYQEFAPRAQGLKKMKVLDTPLVLLVSPDHPRALDGATADDFKTEPFIKAASSRETLSESKNRARRQCRELGFTPSGILITPNLESAYMATEFGQGVLVSTMLSRMSLHSELKCYPIGAMEQLLCFWHGDQENPAVEAFAASLEQVHQ